MILKIELELKVGIKLSYMHFLRILIGLRFNKAKCNHLSNKLLEIIRHQLNNTNHRKKVTLDKDQEFKVGLIMESMRTNDLNNIY